MFRALSNKLWPRLLIGFIVPLILFLAAAVVAIIAIHRLVNALDSEQHSEIVLTKSFGLQQNVLSMTAAERAHHLLGREEFRLEFNRNRAELLENLETVRRLVSDNPDQSKRLGDIARFEEEWYAMAKPRFELWRERQKFFFGEKEFLRFITQLNMERSIALLQKLNDSIHALIQTEIGILETRRSEVRAKTTESMWAIVLAVVVSVGFALGISWLLASSITRPIRKLGQAVASMRLGRFQAVAPYGPVEIADLMRGFNLMGIALAERTTMLEGSELRYRTIVGTTSNILWLTDAHGCNSEMTSWRAFTGQSADEVAGDCWLSAVHPEDRDVFSQRWCDAVRGKKYVEDEVRIRRGDGDYRHFHCRGVPIFDTAGQVSEWVRICIDVTERKREEELRREKEAAEAANRAKSEFLAKMSHELRTPLNAVIGMSKMLTTQRFGGLNAKQLDYLADITNAGEHLLDLINEILDLSKVEVGHMDLAIESVAVAETVEHVVSTLRTLAENKSLTLRIEPPQPDGVIQADLPRFKQILINLLSNAVKFTPAGGRVVIRCQWAANAERQAPPASMPEARAIRIDVEDTGIGIDPAVQDKIGQEFFQANRESHKTQEGTGLGLALSRRLVELMGGHLWFVSTPGQGSTFSFALPIKAKLLDPAVATERTSTSVIAVRHDGKPLALIIDDYAPTNKLLADWLDEAGLRTASAFDGLSGIEKARTLAPQLILLDIRMPNLGGLQVLSQLKAEASTASIPVAVVSILEEDQNRGDLEIVGWFVKPIDKEALLERLRFLLPDLLGQDMHARPAPTTTESNT